MTPILYIKGGNLSFADKKILSDLELYVYPGDKICLVGRNGCGKSSLLKIIIGEYELDTGELFQGPGMTVGYLKQDMKIDLAGSIYDFILKDFQDPETSKYNADIILNKLELDGNLLLKNCSGGQIRRCFLASALVKEPSILLLDEPTNHLDIRAIEWLEEYVKSYQGAIICISHDRTFQENVTNKVWWIDRGCLKKSSRGFGHYDQWREEVITEEESRLRKMNRKLEAEKGWLNTGVTARRKRNQKRLTNLYRLRESLREYQNKLSQAKAKLHIEFAQESTKTKFIMEAENITFAYPGKNIFNDFSLKIKKGEKIGIIGPNGSGKSTLIKVLMKEQELNSGKIKHGTNLEITYFDQHRTALNPNHSLQQILCPTGGDQIFLKNRTMHVAAYLKSFMFDPKLLSAKVATLSGGEANRLLLAKALINPGNFLILDEPTNDLDMDSLEMLSEILADFDGTLLIVSHDRDFLENIVTRSLIFTEDKIIDLYGGYADYLKFYKQDTIVEKPKKSKIEIVKTAAPQSNKLSYKFQRLLEVLPKEIEALECTIVDYEQQLMDSNLYSKNPEKFYALTKKLNDCKILLEQKTLQWIEIEDMQ